MHWETSSAHGRVGGETSPHTAALSVGRDGDLALPPPKLEGSAWHLPVTLFTDVHLLYISILLFLEAPLHCLQLRVGYKYLWYIFSLFHRGLPDLFLRKSICCPFE